MYLLRGPLAMLLHMGVLAKPHVSTNVLDKSRVFIEAPSKSECPFSNPPQVKDKPTLLLLSYGESPF